MAARIGSLLIDLHANVAKLQKDFDKAQKTTKTALGKMGAALKSFAGLTATYFGGREILQFADATMTAAVEVGRSAQQIGVGVEALQELRYAASQVGVEANDLDQILRDLGDRMGDAASGSKTWQEAFAALGVQIFDTHGRMRPVAEVLVDVAEGLRTADSDATRLFRSMELFGDQGARILPLFQQGAEGIEALAAEARDLGIVLDTETVRATERLESNMTKVRATLQGVANQVLTAMLPALNELSTQLSEGTDRTNGLAQSIVAGVRAVVTPLVGFITILNATGKAIGALGSTAMYLATEQLGPTAKLMHAIVSRDFAGAWKAAQDLNARAGHVARDVMVDLSAEVKDAFIESGRLIKALWGEEIPGAVESGATRAVERVGSRIDQTVQDAKSKSLELKEIEAEAARIRDELGMAPGEKFGLSNATTGDEIRAVLGMKPGEKFGEEFTEQALEDRRWREHVEGWSTEFREELDDGADRAAEAGVTWAVGFAQSFAQSLKSGDAMRIFSSVLSGLGSLLTTFIGGPAGIAAGGIAGLFAGMFSRGGLVTGPGGPTTDSVPAMLSDGEYVIRAAAVDRLGVDFLDAINEGRLPGFRNGGMVGDAPAARSALPSVTINVRSLSPADARDAVRQSLARVFPSIREARQEARLFDAFASSEPRYA